VTDSKLLIRRYYSELWNQWIPEALEELISPNIVFRGSIGTAVEGINEFKGYVSRIRSAFPDFHNHVEELIAESDSVVARLTYTGTHRGELFGFRGTGTKVTYQGIAIFHIGNDKVVEGHVLGDTETLKRQLVRGEIAAVAKELPSDFNISLASEREEEWAADVMSRSEPWKTLGRSFDSSLQSMRNPNCSLLVARGENAGPIGFMLIQSEGVAGSPYIKSVAVEEPFRGAGVGTQLLQFADAIFQRRANHIFICVSSFNKKARALYERLGYTIIAELREYIVPGASELLMHKTLPKTIPAVEQICGV